MATTATGSDAGASEVAVAAQMRIIAWEPERMLLPSGCPTASETPMADSSNLKKISQNVSEKKRVESLGKGDAARANIQEIIGNDLVDHEKLITIVFQTFNKMLPSVQKNCTAEDLRRDVLLKCQGSLEKAAERLRATNEDQRVVEAKIRTLNATFINQVNRAMRDAAERQKAAGKK